MKYEFRITKLEDNGVVAYLKVGKGEFLKTTEHKQGQILADYDTDGNLIGIEFLSFVNCKIPSKIKV